MNKLFSIVSYIVLVFFSFSGQVISRSDETIVTNQVYKKDGLFFSQGKLYTGNLRTNYSSGKVKYEWHIENGLLNGKCVGYYE